jgi:hypothetical protein
MESYFGRLSERCLTPSPCPSAQPEICIIRGFPTWRCSLVRGTFVVRFKRFAIPALTFVAQISLRSSLPFCHPIRIVVLLVVIRLDQFLVNFSYIFV